MTFKELLEELFNELDTDDWRKFTILFLSIFKKAQDDEREMKDLDSVKIEKETRQNGR